MEQIAAAAQFLRKKGVEAPAAGIVLGTGMHRLLDLTDIVHIIPYTEIPGFAASTVEFHKGNLIYGSIGDKKILVMQGRFHAYEGYSMQQIVFPIRVMKRLGVQQLFLSNVAGGISPALKKGDLVLIGDHINLQSGNPLTGPNPEELGPRFPDMSVPYAAALKDLLQQKAKELGIPLKSGVYAAVNGPSLETRAEYRYLKIIGADMVGMSTVPEVIAANHMQLPCAAISVITDECDPDHLQPVDVPEILSIAAKADEKVSVLLSAAIRSLPGDRHHHSGL